MCEICCGVGEVHLINGDTVGCPLCIEKEYQDRMKCIEQKLSAETERCAQIPEKMAVSGGPIEASEYLRIADMIRGSIAEPGLAGI